MQSDANLTQGSQSTGQSVAVFSDGDGADDEEYKGGSARKAGIRKTKPTDGAEIGDLMKMAMTETLDEDSFIKSNSQDSCQKETEKVDDQLAEVQYEEIVSDQDGQDFGGLGGCMVETSQVDPCSTEGISQDSNRRVLRSRRK